MANIGFDARSAFLNFSGQGNYSRTLISSLSAFYEDNDYYLYTPEYEHYPILNFCNRKNNFVKKLSSDSIPDGETLKKDKIDLFHGIRAILPENLHGIKSVITMHDAIFMRFPEYYTPQERDNLEKTFRDSCKRADKIIAISRQTADDVIKYLDADPKKVEVVYQSCNRQFYTQPDENKKREVRERYSLPDKYILNVGKYEPRKNIKSVISAMRSIPEEYSLVTAGSPTPYMDELIRYAKELGLESRVHIIPETLFADLPALYSMAELSTYVSFFEGFGMPVLEAMNCGCPVITSKVAAMPEVAGDSALLVDPGNRDEIKMAMQLVLNSPTARESMIRRGYIYAAKFREEEAADKVYDIYNSLLK